MPKVKTGLENLIESPPDEMSKQRIGLLCNPASVSGNLTHAVSLIQKTFPGQLAALYAPQHGYFAEKQDNMIESEDMVNPELQIPVFSLYGKTRVPTREMFDPIDTIIIDLQDVGTRVYTFIYTMSYCLESARRFNKKVVVLDRPNPVGGNKVEGNILKPDCKSFVGRFPIPMRHGMTIGELAQFFNDVYDIGCDLRVIRMKNWNRNMLFRDTGLTWVPPSPNLPTPDSAMVYPGQVLWEGTNVSEGRGTTQPFELFGAPYWNLEKIRESLPESVLSGVILRPAAFEPTSNKWSGRLCNGFQLHVTDPETYGSYRLSLQLLQAVISHHPDSFQWKSPPYEYESEKMPIDLIIGDREIRKKINNNEHLEDIEKSWQKDLEAFRIIRKKFYLYS